MAKVNVLSPGSKVKIIEPEIEGRITAASIRGEIRKIKYEVSWWNGSSRQSDWMEPFEVEEADSRYPTTVGFENS